MAGFRGTLGSPQCPRSSAPPACQVEGIRLGLCLQTYSWGSGSSRGLIIITQPGFFLKCGLLLRQKPLRRFRGCCVLSVWSNWGAGQPSPGLGSATTVVGSALARLGGSEVEMMVLWLAGIWAFMPMAPNQLAWLDPVAYMACGLRLNELNLFSPSQ